MIEHLRRLYAHMEWADRRALAALGVAEHVPAQARELFAHVVGTEHRWFTRLMREEPQVAVWPEATLSECEEILARNTANFRDYLDRLTPDDLGRTVRYTNSAGEDFESRVDDILLHIVLHGMYHRGQVALVLRQHDLAPNATDYIAMIRGVPAATRRDPLSEGRG